MAEKYYGISPYVYCANNPVNAVDVDGRKIIFVNGYLGFGSPQGGKSYWSAPFISGAKTFFNDYNTPHYTDVEHGLLSSASGRYKKGYIYAKEHYSSLIEGMDNDEPFNLVSHSMGGAFSTGIKQYLEEQGWNVKTAVFINTYQSDGIKTKKGDHTFIIDYQNSNDPVLFLLDWNLGMDEIKYSDIKIRIKSDYNINYIHKGPISSGEKYWEDLQRMIYRMSRY